MTSLLIFVGGVVALIGAGLCLGSKWTLRTGEILLFFGLITASIGTVSRFIRTVTSTAAIAAVVVLGLFVGAYFIGRTVSGRKTKR